MNRVITLTTDFGARDGFVGTMKGVILRINPHATIVDITHEIAPQNVQEAAYALAASARYFPANAIHVVVVDPGVGSARRPIAVQVGRTFFVAPDNGVVDFAIEQLKIGTRQSEIIHAVHLNQAKFWLPRVSNTFHGRDIFAPCAAHLSLGVRLQEMGKPINDWVRLAPELPSRRSDGAIVGRVVHIDRFGNVLTNILEDTIDGMDRERIVVEIAGKRLVGLVRSYADGDTGEFIALISSGWELEIAQRDGNAAGTLGIKVGDEVVVGY